MKTSKLINMSKKRKGLWIDSETDLSLISDNNSDITSIQSLNNKKSTNQSIELSNCCLICSILSSLSNANCCQKHLNLLTETSSTNIIAMLSSQVKNCSHSKEKHRYHSLSNKSRHSKNEKRLTSFNSTDTYDLLLSPNQESSSSSSSSIEFQTNDLMNSTMNNSNSLQKSQRNLSSSFLNKRKREIKSIVQNDSIPKRNNNQSKSIETNSISKLSPRISLKRVIHVKDEDEECIIDRPQITFNMKQATKQMTTQINAQPKILLKRISLEL